MSVTQIWGIVLLDATDKLTTESNNTFYAYYKCIIPLAHSNIPATIWLHSPPPATNFTSAIVVLLYGHFAYSSCQELLIEALRLIPFPFLFANEPVYCNLFTPRFTVIGHVVGHPSNKDGVVVFTVTSISYIFGNHRSVTVITPIIMVDNITLEIGNVKIGNLATKAFETLNPMTFRDGIIPDSDYEYEPSSIALGAVDNCVLQDHSIKDGNTQYNLNLEHSGNIDRSMNIKKKLLSATATTLIPLSIEQKMSDPESFSAKVGHIINDNKPFSQFVRRPVPLEGQLYLAAISVLLITHIADRVLKDRCQEKRMRRKENPRNRL
ncbi:hypothetical protein M422DRAFT_245804 [Sphaerobolus stellatus SS14]|nr:hypothetical protein M422DRAFT_245804 [Sphaerobolus stellatus SS14]